jgi:hypothetical protein
LALPVQSTVIVYTVNTIFSGALSNGADGVANGGTVKQRCSPNTRPAAAANETVAYPNGCKLYDNTSYDHNQVVQASWKFSNYPGYWYFYVRSPVSHAPDKSIFRFHLASDLSGSSSVGGYVS